MFAIYYPVALVVLLSLVGCSSRVPPPTSQTVNTLPDYTLRRAAREGDIFLSYWRNSVNWKKYRKIIVEPVVLKAEANSELNQITHAERYRLQEILNYRVREALKGYFMPVTKPNPDTLLVKLTITDMATSMAFLNGLSPHYASGEVATTLKSLLTGNNDFVGKASIQGKVLDSYTGELLMISTNTQLEPKTLLGDVSEWMSVEDSYRYWAAQLNYHFCLQLKLSICFEPH